MCADIDLRRLQDADEKEWERFYHSHLQPLRKRLSRRFGDLSPGEIDDVWAQAIENICYGITLAKEDYSLAGWVWTIARNLAIDHIRRAKTDLTLLDEAAAMPDDTTLELDVDAGPTHLEALLDEMSPSYATLLMLRAGPDPAPDEVIYFLTGQTPSQQRGRIGHARTMARRLRYGDGQGESQSTVRAALSD